MPAHNLDVTLLGSPSYRMGTALRRHTVLKPRRCRSSGKLKPIPFQLRGASPGPDPFARDGKENDFEFAIRCVTIVYQQKFYDRYMTKLCYHCDWKSCAPERYILCCTGKFPNKVEGFVGVPEDCYQLNDLADVDAMWLTLLRDPNFTLLTKAYKEALLKVQRKYAAAAIKRQIPPPGQADHLLRARCLLMQGFLADKIY